MTWASTLETLRIALAATHLFIIILLVWLSWYRRHNRDPIFIAVVVWCAVTAGFFLFRSLAIQSPAHGLSFAQRMAWVTALLWIPCGLAIAWAVTRQRFDRLRWAVLGGSLLLSLAPLAGQLFLAEPAGKITDLLGAPLQFAAPGPLFYVTGPALVATCVYIFLQARSTDVVGTARRRVVMFTVAVMLPALANDALIASGAIRSIFLAEVAFLFQVVVNTPLLISWTVESMQSLEAAVDQRTRQLRKQQVELAAALLNTTELIDGLPDTIVVHRGGTFRFVNGAGEAFLGYDAAELIGRQLADLVVAEDRERAVKLFRAMERSRPPSAREELRFLRRDGATLYGEVVGLSFTFEGEPSAVAIIRDVGQRRDLEAQVQLSDKLASVGQLTASIGHEIANPLTFLLANINLINERLERQPRSKETEELRALSAEAADGAARVQDILRDLRTFARADQDDDTRRPLDVHDPLKVALNMARTQIKHVLATHLAPVPQVLGNGSRLTQVFVNLLVNAMHALPEHKSTHRITVTTRVDGRSVVVEVADTGDGIPKQIQDQIFEPFFTTKPAGVGTGLGLSLCRKIVRSHGGEISVESAPGEGTTFVVRLPASQQKPVKPARRLVRRSSPRRAQVLIVDDEVLVARSIARMLGEHEVTIAEDGEEALALCRLRSFDLILCDLLMPRMSGLELYEGFRALGGRLAERIVFMSGGSPSHEEALASLPNQLLEKPIDRRELDEIVYERIAAGC